MFDWLLVLGCFLVLPLIGLASLGRELVTRRRLVQAARAPTWGDLTDGSLTLTHRGPLVTFWASGGRHPYTWKSMGTTAFVVIDEVALVAAELHSWPKPVEVTWLVRDSEGMALRVTNSWLGPAIVHDESGLMLVWRSSTPTDVTTTLQSLGWMVADA